MQPDLFDAFVGDIQIDGETCRVSDLTFGEQRTFRRYLRELAPDNDEDEAGQSDAIPALITVIKQRAEPAFTLEQALAYKPADVEPPPTQKATGKK